MDKHINRGIVIPARNVTLVKATNRLTEDRLVDGVLMNNSVSVDRVEQVLHRAVPRMKIIDADSAASLNVSFNEKRAKGDEVAMSIETNLQSHRSASRSADGQGRVRAKGRRSRARPADRLQITSKRGTHRMTRQPAED